MNRSQYEHELLALRIKRDRHLSNANVHEQSGNLAGAVAERERASWVEARIEELETRGWEE